MPDGSVQGTDKLERNGNTYTLTDDVNVEINNQYGLELDPGLLVMKSDIVIDGAGHTIKSNGTGLGIYARGVHGITIENFRIRGFVLGISSYISNPGLPIELIYQGTWNNRIINNDIDVPNSTLPYALSTSGWGIMVEFSQDILVSGNTIKTADAAKGLYVGPTCNRTTITNNNFLGCGMDLYTLKEKTMSGNTIDGKPVVFLNGVSSQTVEDGEQVLIYNCQDITVKNIRPNNNYRRTIQLEKTGNSAVTNCQGRIALISSENNQICDNTPNYIALYANSSHNQVFGNTVSVGYVNFPRADYEYTDGRRCIDLFSASRNDIYNNTLRDSNQGIHLGEPEGASQYNKIYQNDISNVQDGVLFLYSPQNYLYSNNIWNCSVGISISASNDEMAVQNNITNCGLAINIVGSNNRFYHNNLVNNKNQAAVHDQHLFDSQVIVAYSVNNSFDNGYPDGGNYWSNFLGVDANGDGISETAFIIDSNNTDRYPFIQPIGFSNFVPPIPPNEFVEPTPTPTPTPTAPPIGNTPTPTQQSTPKPKTPVAPELDVWIIVPLFALLTLITIGISARKFGSNKKSR